MAPALGDRERRVPARRPTGDRWDVLGPRADLLDADDIGTGPAHKVHEPVPNTRANPVDVPAHDPHPFRLRGVGDRLHWSPAPDSPVERGDSLPEHGRRRAFPRLPLVDDGFVRRTHQRGQLRLAHAARATNRANLRVVVAWNAGPGQWRATIIWADRAPIVRPPKRPGSDGSRADPEAAKGRPGVISHWQPPVPRR